MRYAIAISTVGILMAGFVSRTAVDAQQDQKVGRDKDKPNIFRERGVFESASVIDVRAPMTGSVLKLVPEMSIVKPGDLIVELDSAKLEGERVARTVNLDRAKAAVERAKTQLKAIQTQMALEIAAHELNVKVARLALDAFASDDGELAHQRASLDSESRLANARREAAVTELKGQQAAIKQGTAPIRGLAVLKVAVLEAEATIDSATRRKRILENHSQHQQAAVLELKRLLAEKDLVIARHDQVARVQAAEADVIARIAAVKLEESRLVQLKRQIKSCAIHATQTGTVMYGSPATRRTNPYRLKVGSTVRERQVLMHIVDRSKLRLKVLVYAPQIARIKVGQQATIRVDAYPDKTFRGSVTMLSDQPEPVRRLGQNVKEFAVRVEINGIKRAGVALKPGLTAVVEILTDPEKGE